MSGRYPSEPELKQISQWQHNDLLGLFEFIVSIWEYADIGYARRKGRKFWLSTGGWSGNEEIIGALKENHVAYGLTAYSWRRGGHYVFYVPKVSSGQKIKSPRKTVRDASKT